MHLQEYRLKHGFTYKTLGLLFKTSASTAYYWCSGKVFPPESKMKKVEIITQKEVNHEDQKKFFDQVKK